MRSLASDACTPYVTEQRDVYRYTGAAFLIGNDRFETNAVED